MYEFNSIMFHLNTNEGKSGARQIEKEWESQSIFSASRSIFEQFFSDVTAATLMTSFC